MFLGRYKTMLSLDCKLIYNTKDYHRKRLKVLEKEKYIRRIDRSYIKLDDKGTKIVKEFGYDYSFKCRKKSYIDRLNEIARIAALGLNSDIEFIASWDLKDYTIFTEKSRKYIGQLKYQGKERITYYISRDKQTTYISQIINDIQKLVNYENIIIFMENIETLKNYKRFIFGKESTLIIKPTQQNFEVMRKLNDIDPYQIIKLIYHNKEILLSNWTNADYMTEENDYILWMPFIDIEKLHSLNISSKNNQMKNKKIDILTLKDNKEKINEILINKSNIIEIDNWLGGSNENKQKS